MSEQPPTATTETFSSSPRGGVFGTKIPSSVTLAIAVLLFFMPFLDIKCNSMSLQKISGFELATGFKVKTGGDSFLGGLDKMGNSESGMGSKVQKKDPNMYAMIALGMGILGLVLSLAAAKSGGIGAMLTGIVGAVSLILLMVDVKSDIKTEISNAGKDGITLSVDFTPAFYIAIVLFLTAAYFGYRRMKGS